MSGRIIEAQDLTKRFGTFTAVDGISFSVDSGEILGFLGPNGAGKTTTIRMLTTLLAPTAGRLLVCGADPVRSRHEVRQSIGLVFQDPSVDEELTAWENMEYHGVLYKVPGPERRRKIEELLSFLGLWGRKDDFVKTFSGGMRRRLEIARGLLHHPRILFLDEPTLGLDPQTRNHIWDYLRDLRSKEGTTIFFTTHYIEEAERAAGRVIVIDHGRVMASGSPAELKTRAGAATLEAAFISLTGRSIRDEEVGMLESMRMNRWAWRGRR